MVIIFWFRTESRSKRYYFLAKKNMLRANNRLYKGSKYGNVERSDIRQNTGSFRLYHSLIIYFILFLFLELFIFVLHFFVIFLGCTELSLGFPAVRYKTLLYI
mgnify:CR=1 FL=1